MGLRDIREGLQPTVYWIIARGRRHGGAQDTLPGPKGKGITISPEIQEDHCPPKKATIAKSTNKPSIRSPTSLISGLLVGQEVRRVRGDQEVREEVRETRGNQGEIPLSAASRQIEDPRDYVHRATVVSQRWARTRRRTKWDEQKEREKK